MNRGIYLTGGGALLEGIDKLNNLCSTVQARLGKYADEYGYSYGENLEAGLDVSMEVSDSMLKTQMIAAFEEELVKLYFDTHREMAEANDLISRQQREEYERYRDIADGIIIL